ncbi:MAG: hypothetical protein JSW00_07715 [Thermoplasmata archaeon]|nr:MAG: hypothetical protein JSW00_07715 [Thermoplasmata archaeon]
MALCDMCNNTIARGEGLLVHGEMTSKETRGETESILTGILGLTADEAKAGMDSTEEMMSASPSLVCETCANRLDLSATEMIEARRRAKTWWQTH